ncbi:MAG: iron ABC transporter permease, partial [Muribaculaceae bacterium]|nr:iron ABC transporter permease [Muribaculaceae bacterium]
MMRLILLVVLSIALLLANLFFGAIDISPREVITVLTGGGEEGSTINFIILESRLPQAITAFLAGAGLAVSGLLLQTTFRNPLAGPTILGVSSGASLGVAIVMLFLGGSVTLGSGSLGGYMGVVGGALAGSFTIMGILILLSTILKNDLMLLIVGIMIGYLTSSVVTLLSSLSTAEGIKSYVMWGMGTFADVSLPVLPLYSALCIVGLGLTVFLAKPLNLLLLGENYARNLGVNVVMTRNILLLSTGLLTAVITAFCGPIGFIGISVPHISRLIFRSDNHFILIPSSILTGGVMALACNLASTLPDNHLLPINALTP